MWAELCAVVEPYYPRCGNGRPPIDQKRMLRLHFIQHCFNLADFACDDALYVSARLRRFARVWIGRQYRTATALLKFRRLLETLKLGEKLIAEVGHVASGMKLQSVTVVDATIIGAPKFDEE
ncbi:hypothetical protein QF001_000148 [Paraburkholderia youngii]